MAGYMGHFDYLEDVLGMKPSHKDFRRNLEAMEKYESPWWFELRNNPVELAAKQMEEPVLLIESDLFVKGVQKVLGTSVSKQALLQGDKDIIEAFKEKYQAGN